MSNTAGETLTNSGSNEKQGSHGDQEGPSNHTQGHEREKYKVGKKVLAVDAGEGILLKPIPNPARERGSLKGVLHKSARETLAEVRSEDVRKVDALNLSGEALGKNSLI